jgi:hypothetical protein
VNLGGGRYATIELLAARGDNDHLVRSGVAVHVVDTADKAWNERPLVIARAVGGELIATEGVTAVFESILSSVKVGRVTEESDGTVVADIRFRRDEPTKVPRL